MTKLRGTLSHVQSIDAWTRIGFTLHAQDGGSHYLVASEASEATTLAIRAAAEMGDLVEVTIEPIAPRLGAPSGTVTDLHTIEYAGVHKPLAKAA